MAEPLPIDELDPELEGRLRLADELVLIDAKNTIECPDRRNGRFSDAHNSDFLGFDENDLAWLVLGRDTQCCGGHPAGRSAADDHDFSNVFVRRGFAHAITGHRFHRAVSSRRSPAQRILSMRPVSSQDTPAQAPTPSITQNVRPANARIIRINQFWPKPDPCRAENR